MSFGRALCKTDPEGVGPSMLFVYQTDPEGVGWLLVVLVYPCVAPQCATDPVGVGLSMCLYLAAVRVL